MSDSEVSQPNAPAPAPVASHSPGITIQGKTLAQVAAIAVAAALGGGGVSFAAQPADELRDLRTVIETVALSVNEIKSELRFARETTEKIESRIDDLESRMRTQEACICEER